MFYNAEDTLCEPCVIGAAEIVGFLFVNLRHIIVSSIKTHD